MKEINAECHKQLDAYREGAQSLSKGSNIAVKETPTGKFMQKACDLESRLVLAKRQEREEV